MDVVLKGKPRLLCVDRELSYLGHREEPTIVITLHRTKHTQLQVNLGNVNKLGRHYQWYNQL